MKDTHYAVDTANNLILFSWDYSDVDKEDFRAPGAKNDFFFNDLRDMFDLDIVKRSKIYTKKGIAKLGLNPDDNKCWWNPYNEAKAHSSAETNSSTQASVESVVESVLNEWVVDDRIEGLKDEMAKHGYVYNDIDSYDDGQYIVFDSEFGQFPSGGFKSWDEVEEWLNEMVFEESKESDNSQKSFIDMDKEKFFAKTGLSKGSTIKALKRGAKVGAKIAPKVGKAAAAKAGTKVVAKSLGKSVLKKVPVVGLGVGAKFAYDRAKAGDMLGAAGEIGSGIASCLPGPGTAVSLGIDGALAARDIAKANGGRGEQADEAVDDGEVHGLNNIDVTVRNIEWDADDPEDIRELPTTVRLNLNYNPDVDILDDLISDTLSNEYGFEDYGFDYDIDNWNGPVTEGADTSAETSSGTSREEFPIPCDGLFKRRTIRAAHNFIYNAVYPHTTGLFRDESWENIHNIFNILVNELKVNLSWGVRNDNYYRAGYSPDGKSKVYVFEIKYRNIDEKNITINGQVIASGAGTVEYPMSRYDIAFQLF